MLRRWFSKKSRLEHADPDIRLASIAALEPDQLQACQPILERLAREDQHSDVRRAAISRVLNPEVLKPLLDEEAFAAPAAEQIAKSLQAGQQSSGQDHPLVVQAYIERAEPKDLDTLWPLLCHAEQCAELAIRLRDTHRERVLSHPLLQSEAGLTTLQRLAKGRDKTCHRFAREHLEQIKQMRTQIEDSQARVGELDQAINKTLDTNDAQSDPVQYAKLLKLADMRKQAVAEFDKAIAKLHELNAENSFSLPTNPLVNVDLSAPEPHEDPFPQLVSQLEALDNSMRNGDAITDLRPLRDEITQRWLSQADKYPPSATQHKLFERLARQFTVYADAWERLEHLEGWRTGLPTTLQEESTLSAEILDKAKVCRQWLKRWHKRIRAVAWPADHTLPADLLQAQDALKHVQSYLEQVEQLLQQANAKLTQTLQKAQAALDAGEVENTKSCLRDARTIHKSLGEAASREHERVLASLSAKVAEFRDWQQFATSPKRQLLLDEVQQLAEQPLEPAAQAARLKHLRSQWRELGRPNSAAEADMQRHFNELADTAFAPCRAYFAEQAEIRKTNLDNRKALCSQLETYLESTDWQKADMRAAETILRQARDEWHSYHPCDRQQLKPVQQKFEALQDSLHAKIRAAWDANVQHKQTIVEQAQALLSDPEDLQTRIDAIKRLQSEWQQVGVTPRGQDQRLWREFRKACDAVFAQRDADKQAAKAAQEAQYTQLEQAIEALNTAASGSEVSRKQYDELSKAIQVASQGIKITAQQQKKMDAASKAYQGALKQADQAQAQALLSQWLSWDTEVSEAEQNSTPFDPPNEVFANRANGTAQPQDYLKLVLEAEIAADIASPEEDRNTRMALQVELMNAGRRDLAGEDYKDLLHRWCAAGPKHAELDPLRKRFFQALAQRL